MFLLILFTSSCFLIWIAVLRGSRDALAWGVAIALTLPTWNFYQISSVTLDYHACLGALLVACIILQAPSQWTSRLVWLDFLVMAFAVLMYVSVVRIEGFRVSHLYHYPALWVLPYLLGRLAFGSEEDLRRFVTPMALAILVLCGLAMVEAVVRVNLLLNLAGSSSWYEENSYRFGLKRAEGPTEHPIFFGMLLVLFLPWALSAARQARLGDGPSWWRMLPWLNVAGIAATISRGPIMAAVIAMVVFAYFQWKKSRGLIVACSVAAVAAVVVGRSFFMGQIHAIGGVSGEVQYHLIIDGQAYAYTGTNYRLLLLKVYEDAMLNAGLFGYGRVGPEHFMPLEGQLANLFGSIDNHYIHTVLSAGYLGLGCFVLLGLTSCGYALKQIKAHPDDALRAGMFGAMVSVLIMMTTVWFHHDYAFAWLFSAGLVGSWHAVHLSQPGRNSSLRSRRVVPVRRLSPPSSREIAI